MAGINTYIKEYGDKTFNEEKFNEIDNVILSSVVYLNFDGIVPKNKKSISLCEAGNIFLYKYNAKHCPIINARSNENISNAKNEIPKAPVYV